MDKKSVTTLTLKQINKHTVYQYIYRQRETSKFQIVQDLNMGLSTVSQNLTTLEKEGLIDETGIFPLPEDGKHRLSGSYRISGSPSGSEF